MYPAPLRGAPLSPACARIRGRTSPKSVTMASELDLDAYLARIGERAPLAPDVDGLASLHRAHCAAIPFENLDLLLGRAIALDLPALEPGCARRGGYCFEQNTLFEAALEARASAPCPRARVRVGTTVRPRTHMLLRVDCRRAPSWRAPASASRSSPEVHER